MRSIGLALGCLVIPAGAALAQQLPLEPPKQFGTSITGAFEGWFDNPDGSHSFLVGYLNRNRSREVDIPVGPQNQIEPGGPDRGQPTHFLPGRQWGMFVVTVPKEFSAEQRLVWTIIVNGQSNSIPLHLHPDYNISPLIDASGNTPPVMRFEERGAEIQGPIGNVAAAINRATSMSAPLPLSVWVTDDMKYTTDTNAPMRASRPPVTLVFTKYRGAGSVTFDPAKVNAERIPGGAAAFQGKGTTTVKFSEPGEYMLQVTANDYSGVGGLGFECCWTTAIVKVAVTH